jgi:hypothetical protein
MTAFSGIKDVDLKIMSELADRELFNVCSQVNKYINYICKDESFWRNRFIKKYGNIAIQYKPENRTWRNHYLQVVIDLERFSKNPIEFFNYIIWYKDLEHSFYKESQGMSYSDTKIFHLKDAPEWVMTNLYLLDLGEFFVLGKGNNYMVTKFSHPNPIDILTFIFNKEIGIMNHTEAPIISIYQSNHSNMYYPERGLLKSYTKRVITK